MAEEIIRDEWVDAGYFRVKRRGIGYPRNVTIEGEVVSPQETRAIDNPRTNNPTDSEGEH